MLGRSYSHNYSCVIY